MATYELKRDRSHDGMLNRSVNRAMGPSPDPGHHLVLVVDPIPGLQLRNRDALGALNVCRPTMIHITSTERTLEPTQGTVYTT